MWSIPLRSNITAETIAYRQKQKIKHSVVSVSQCNTCFQCRHSDVVMTVVLIKETCSLKCMAQVVVIAMGVGVEEWN